MGTSGRFERSEKRRAVLESLQIRPITPGRLADGLEPTDRVLLASFRNPAVADQLRRELSELGIPSWLKPEGIRTQVEVAYRDRDRAYRHCEDLRRREPDHVPRILRRRHDFVLFGAVLGACLGLTALNYHFTIAAIVWLGFIVNGALLGYVLDPYRLYRRGHPGQFTLVDLLLLTTAIGVMFASVKYFLVIANDMAQ